MIVNILSRSLAQLVDAFTYESGQEAANAMADATRWGWLPALSGVAVGRDHARWSHAESVPERSDISD